MSADRDVLQDIADGYHLAAVAGLTGEEAALATDSVGLAVAAVALRLGYGRRAVTLGGTSAAAWITAHLIH